MRDSFAKAPLNALRAFDRLVRCGSHAKAAAELGVTVSALSHQIRKLEAHLGATLVVTTGRRLALTSSGKYLAKAVSDGFDRVRSGLDNFGKDRPLRLAVCSLFAAALLAPRWQLLEARVGEQLELCLSALPAPSQAADVALCLRSHCLRDHTSIEVFTGVAAPVGTPSLRHALGNAAAAPWISCTRWDSAAAEWQAAACSSFTCERVIRAEGLLALYTACLKGMGLTILPIDLIQRDLHDGSLVEVFPNLPRMQVDFVLYFPRDRLDIERMGRLALALGTTARSLSAT